MTDFLINFILINCLIPVLQCDALQKHLENLTLELKAQEEKFMEKERDLRIADEDMVAFNIRPIVTGPSSFKSNILFLYSQATIRINYEEQIAVLTEQVISLSDQLAALK